MITAIQNRIVLAGSVALTSVYDAPVTLPRLGEHQSVAIQPVGDRLQHDEQEDQDGEMAARRQS